MAVLFFIWALLLFNVATSLLRDKRAYLYLYY